MHPGAHEAGVAPLNAVSSMAPLTVIDGDGVLIELERVTLRRVSPTLAFASVRLREVHLKNLRVHVGPNGALTVTPPESRDNLGRTWPHYDLQPEPKAAVEVELTRLWDRA